MKSLVVCVAMLISALIWQSPALAQASDVRAVPTYESAGLYWANPLGATALTGCEVKYRKAGASAWSQGLPMWFDVRNGECRGSLVYLTPDTDYQVELNLPGQPVARSLSFRTWANQKPVARTITVPSGGATLNITEGGSPNGYVVYKGAPGAVLDANNATQFNVSVNASYVIVRGLVLKGAQRDAIRISPTVSDVIIEDNEITGWGRLRSGTWGMDLDSGVRAICSGPTLQRVTIQRNEIHDPRYGANSWSDGHPQGPQAVTLSYCGGNHVIRHNEIFASPGHYYNDIIGGEDNYSKTGFPNADSDIYGNDLSHGWDDAIEAEGGNNNVRIWGNYMDQTGTGVASTVTSVGPLYIFRNVWNRGRILEKSPLDQDDRQAMFKTGSDATLGDGRRYLFHNTMLQATQAGAVYTLGGSQGASGTGSTQLMNNTVSRNNIYHVWRSWTAFYDVGVNNDFANDMYNGGLGATIVAGIHAPPAYAPGNGWQSESGGLYQLAAGTPGYDQAVRIPNFNDMFIGAAPDVGAAEAGAGAMKFGVAASPGAAAPQPATPESGGVPVLRYRLYSPVTQEHHFTTDPNEYNVLGSYGGTWVQEGTVGKVLNAPGSFNGVVAVPYFRLYNGTTRWHHWTTDANEYNTLIRFPGWQGEGVDGYILPTSTTGATQLYRLVFPDGRGLHHWTIDANEYNTLISTYGWVGEGGSGFVIQ